MANYPVPRIEPTVVGRERSPALWRGVLEQYGNDPTLGTLFADDFTTPRTNATVATANNNWFLSEDGVAGAASEAFSTNSDPNGVAVLSAATDTDHEGVKAQAGEAATQGENIALPTHATGGKSTVVFETRVYLNDQANDTFFIGLAEADASILGNTSVPEDDIDYIGFYRLDGGDIQFIVRNDNAGDTAVEYEIDVVSAANSTEDGYVKLGFRVNHDNSVEVYVDGARVTKTSDTGVKVNVTETALPIESLTRTLLCARGVTNDNTTVSLNCDWIDCYVAE